MDLSIIIPVYNVEKYIQACIDSIFRQGLAADRFEVIIVNDGTQDRSMEVIADIVAQHDNIVIINQENQGLSMARNNGMAIAKGEYILFVDSDDMLVSNSLKPIISLALETKPDMVVADYQVMDDEKIESLKRHEARQNGAFSYQETTGRELFLHHFIYYQCNVWRALYRREFLVANKMRFVPGIRYEDVPFTHEAYLRAKKCMRASWLLYIYRIGREGAITNGLDLSKAKDMSLSIGKTWQLLHVEGLSREEKYKLTANIHDIVSAMIYATVYTMPEMGDRLTVVSLLKQNVPEMWFDHGLLQRAESFLLWNAPKLYIYFRSGLATWKRFKRRCFALLRV